jgi:hypothetical protein
VATSTKYMGHKVAVAVGAAKVLVGCTGVGGCGVTVAVLVDAGGKAVSVGGTEVLLGGTGV